MGRRGIDESMGNFSRMINHLLEFHSEEKGLIHCASYALGQKIVDCVDKRHKDRIIFPRSAEERQEAFESHCASSAPSVIVTPSMTEGFDFKGEFARWQVIAKVPYPSLGDKQVAVKKDRNPDWYTMETVKTVIQAAGRIGRSEDDFGVTYITDDDFNMLLKRGRGMFPRWFTEAIVDPTS